jgi:hypothetical protein
MTGGVNCPGQGLGVTSCLQSQFGRDRYLRRCEGAQVDAASALSVVVGWGPVRTAVNGTLVARPAWVTPVSGCAVGFTLTVGVRPVFGDHRLVGKSPEGSRQLGGETRTPAAAVVASVAVPTEREPPAESWDRCCPLLTAVVLTALVRHGPSADRAV